MSRSLALLAVLAALLAPAEAAMSDDAILPFEAVEKTLDNGLKVIVVPTGFPNLVSLQIPVQTGSRNEIEPGKTGFAHFFEHMMFRGTKDVPPEKYQEIVTRAGARQNAYTTDDYTNYHITFPKEDLETILALEADRFMHLEYPVSAFRTEALAVLGEYNKNFANPIRKLFEVQRNAAFTVHPYKHTTMGFIEDIEDMPNEFEYSRTFFDRWYRPEYATVLIVGDVDPDATVALVEKHFGAWERGGFTAEIPPEPAPQGPITVHHDWPAPTPPLVAVAFHGPRFSTTEPDSAAMDMLLRLRFGPTSDLYRRLVEEEQKVDVLFTGNAEDADPALISIVARVKDPADAAYVRDAILAEAARARTEPIDPKRLAEAKSNLRYALSATFDNSEAIAATLAAYVRFERKYSTLNDLFRLYQRLEVGDLQAAAKTYFTDARLVVATLASDPLPEAMHDTPSLDAVVKEVPKDADPRLLVRKSTSPQIVMKLLFHSGSADDPPGKEGLAELTARMIADAGSEAATITEIKQRLYPMAGRFSAQVDREMTTFTLSVHQDNLAEFLDVVLPQLLTPGLRPDDFARNRDAQKNALVVDLRSNNDEELGKERLQALVFAGTPYAHPTAGTVAGIEAITVDDVRDFARRHYTFGNLLLGMSGNVGDDFVVSLHDRLQRGLPAGTPAQGKAEPAPAAHAADGLQVDIVAKDTRATAISFGQPLDVTRGDADFVALWLARTWLGEHRSSLSRLYQVIREERGMNYGDYAYIEAFPGGMYQFFPDANRARLAQLFEVWIRPVPPEQAVMALKLALHEVRHLVEHGLTPEQFESTREYLSKNVFLMTDGQANELGYLLDSRWHGIPEFTRYMRDGLKSLTVEAVNDAIRRHFDPANLHVVMIAKDAEGLKRALLSDEPTSVTYNSEKPEEVLAHDREVGAMRLGLTDADVRITPVEDVFAK